MKILITGGCGFIGSHVVDLLAAEGNLVELLIVDNLSSGENIDKSLRNARLDVFDIINADFLEHAFQKFRPEVAIHLAAQPAITISLEEPIHDLRVNAIGTLNVIKAAKEVGARVIFSSTSAVYDDANICPLQETDHLVPSSPYGMSKLAAEFYIRTYLQDYVILRFGNVYGPRQVPLGENQVIPRMIRHFEKGTKFEIHGDGSQKRDFVFVKDVAQAVALAIKGKIGIYNIASGFTYSINELASMVEEMYGLPKPYPWKHSKYQDPRQDSRMDIDTARRGLQWYPTTSMKDGLLQTLEWWRATFGPRDN